MNVKELFTAFESVVGTEEDSSDKTDSDEATTDDTKSDSTDTSGESIEESDDSTSETGGTTNDSDISEEENTDSQETDSTEAVSYTHLDVYKRQEVYITNARHKAALEEADRSLDLVRNSIEMGMPEDFFSIDLMNAYENLGKILGESVGEDLVNEIFSKFCMGK